MTLDNLRERPADALAAATTEQPEIEIVDDKGRVVLVLWIPASDLQTLG